jgi:hypothetical protein
VSRPAGYDDQVRAWAAALRARDTRTWAEFRAAGPAPVSTGPVPGSAQLELLRRLGTREIARDFSGDFSGLADLVLGTASPGRGLVDPPLPWPGADAFGTPAVEPEAQPVSELVRAAVAVLARLLVDRPAGPAARARVPRAPWRQGFVLAGAPVSVRAVREALLAAGWREGGRRATYLVLGGPLEDLMAERWSARIDAGAGMRWRRMWRTAATRDRIPAGIDLPALAEQFAARVGSRRVRVLLDEDPAARAGELLGVSITPIRPDVVATDLLRELNPLLVLARGESGRDILVAGPWAAALARVRRSPQRLGTPPAFAGWAADAAGRMADRLSAGDYAVLGDPALLARRRPVRPAVPAEHVLDLALDLIATLWKE